MESLHEEVGDDEVQFREDDARVGSPTPPIPITTIDMEVIIKGWEDKFLSYAPSQRSHGEHAVHAVDAHRDTSQTASGI